jgi:hypothetical protein
MKRALLLDRQNLVERLLDHDGAPQRRGVASQDASVPPGRPFGAHEESLDLRAGVNFPTAGSFVHV